MGCRCTECSRLRPMTHMCSFSPELAEAFAQVTKHDKIVADSSTDPIDAASTLMSPSSWWNVEYNPDAFLPLPLHQLFLTGYFPFIKWPSTLPSDQNVSICYVIGCGRSGTTLLAQILAAHPQVCVLNEPRLLWREKWDVWSVNAETCGGKLKAQDMPDDAIMNHYRQVSQITRKPWIVEKFPEHGFKLGALQALWRTQQGHAVFVYVKRQPRAVAKSISKFSFPAWYGACGYKWNCVRKLADPNGSALSFIDDLEPELGMFARGCVEYCACIHEINQSNVPVVVVEYESIISDPQGAVQAFDFLPAEGFQSVSERAKALVRPASVVSLSAQEEDVLARLKSFGGIYNAL
eukprot:GEMP01060080.1.p1 GENE.GEMP01060080.1~~GEMP01060080.1.p1  ORF type:complete len:367 (+),score=60.43 GEMP01060080.1:52-1101(+)